MSTIGLNTNTYRVTSKYLDLLNDFVVKVKIDQNIENIQKEYLIEFISKLSDVSNTQPQFQLLSNIVERELRSSSMDFTTFFESLISEIKLNNLQVFLPKIEFLADVLETENSEALLKIIGE